MVRCPAHAGGCYMKSNKSHANATKDATPATIHALRELVEADLRVLDNAIEAVGSERVPIERADRGPLPMQGLPVFNPATLTYRTPSSVRCSRSA